MACGTDSVNNNFVSMPISNFVACELCSELDTATNHCDECLINMCDGCALSHRRQQEAKGRHHVQPGVCKYDMEIELCPEDGQKMSFFCSLCRVRVCPECELTRKHHIMHQVVPLDQFLGQEKEKLLERLDDVTTKIGTVSHLPDDIKATAVQIELKWLERKEMMRQEFTSLLEAITTRQKTLMAEMEEEVAHALQKLEELQKTHEKVVSSSCQLSDDCILAVQDLLREDFLKSYPQFLDSAKALEGQVEKLSSPADCMPAFLQLPFSLHFEKVGLDSRLQLHTYDCQHLKAREYMCFIPLECLGQEVTVDMLVDTPSRGDVPTSSHLQYRVNIYAGSRKSKLDPVWTSKILRKSDVVLNGKLGYKLLPRSLYTLTVQPVISVHTHQGLKTVNGKCISIMVVTEGSEPENRRGAAWVASGAQNISNNSTFTGRNMNPFKNRHHPHQHQNRLTNDHQASHVLRSAFPVPILSLGSTRNSPYQCDIGQSECDRQYPVTLHQEPVSGNMQCQSRVVQGMCSFEEARLIEVSKSEPVSKSKPV